jgi:DNA-binding phage protein
MKKEEINYEVLKSFPKWEDRFHRELKDDNFAKGILKEAINQFNEDGELKYLLSIIKNIAEHSNLNITKLMEESGLSRPTFYNVVSLKTKPTFHTVQTLLKAFGANVCVRLA